jgi:hypothetical protein
MEKVTSPDGTTLAFDQLGSGSPLIVVAGASCDRAVDRPLADELAKYFTVLNYDRRGRGESTDTPPYAVEREVEDIGALVDAAGGSAAVVGMSSGAVLAAHAAAGGLALSHLVMWEPPFRLDQAGRRVATEYAGSLRALLADGRRGDALELFMRTVGLPEQMIAGMRQSPYWSTGEAMAPTLAYDAAVMGDGSVPVERFASVPAATLVLGGGASPDWMRHAARAAAEAVPGATYRELAEQTHDVAPSVLAAAVRDFVTPYTDRS